MTIETDQQMANTKRKLDLLEQQISKAKSRPETSGGRDSLHALTQMANQLREEIVRYRSRERRAS